MLCQEGILDQHSWFGQTLEQPRWSYCLFENLVEVILMNYESWDFKQVPCQVSISLCPPYSLSKYPCQAVAWSKSTTVHGQDHDPHRVTFGDFHGWYGDLLSVYRPDVNRLAEDAQGSNLFLVAHWHSLHGLWMRTVSARGRHNKLGYQANRGQKITTSADFILTFQKLP